MKRIAACCLAAGLVLIGCVTVMKAQDAKLKEFRLLWETELRNAGIVGGSLVVINDNRAAAHYTYGLANVSKSQPVDENTIYHWASITKTFTGIAIMQLRDRGMLKLDDPVTKYLPELRSVNNPHGSMDDIKILHLMTHSSGMRAGTWPWSSGADWEPFEPTHYEQLVAMLPYTQTRFKAGSKYSYSNPGIVFLGRIIEHLTGDDLEVYIDKNIFKPLEMHRSYFDATPYHLLRHRSHSYAIDKGKRTEGVFDANTGITVSNGGLNSPIPDMVRYLNFLLGDPAMKERYDGVLRRQSLEEMWVPRLPTDRDANGNAGATTDIGMIFFLDTRLGKRHLGHTGSQNNFTSLLDFDPDKRVATLLVVNTAVGAAEGSKPEDHWLAKVRKAIAALY